MMRTTLDLPDSLLRELKTRAAQNGQSLKSLLNELIQRAMRMPATPDLAQQAASALPVLKRLQNPQGEAAKPTPAQSNEQLEDQALQEDIEKLRRIGFIR
jgi:plasmid stability protein